MIWFLNFWASSTSKPNSNSSLLSKLINSNLVHLEIVEGKYHQVKRMFAYTGNKVIKLHRLEFAGFRVDDLKDGEFKILENDKI